MIEANLKIVDFLDISMALKTEHKPYMKPNNHSTKKPVTTMLTYPWKCTVLHCNHLGNTWKPLVLITRHFDYHPR